VFDDNKRIELQNICLKVVDFVRNTRILTGCTTFPKIYDLYPIFRRQKGDMTQIPYWGHTSILRTHKNLVVMAQLVAGNL
jgi:hypothetical protein